MPSASTPVNRLRSLVARLRTLPSNDSDARRALAHADTLPAPDLDEADGAIELADSMPDAVVLLSDEERRLRIAQHWARASLAYESGDAWAPIVHACAVAALVCRDLEELRRHLGRIVGELGAEPATANAWRAVLLELDDATAGEGLAIAEPNAWAWPVLQARLSSLLDAARDEAERRRACTRITNDSPEHEVT